MEPNENPDEGLETSSAKVVTGVRTHPELKMQLTEEGGDCGMSTSEYCEMILFNRHKEKAENERLRALVAVLQTQVSATGGKQFEVVQAELEQLRKKITEQNNQLAIFSDNRLLYLYENVKGKKDTVEDAYHPNFSITYNSTVDVLKALIYSTKLNN